MSKQTIALAYNRPADALEESEYQALVQALSESARGRGFLAEHARRSRSAETNILLTAIERIEAQVQPQPPARQPLHDDLRRLLDDIHTARARIEAHDATPKAEQLSALLDILQRRLRRLLPPAPAASVQPAAPPPQKTVAPTPPPRPSAAHWLDALPEPSVANNDVGAPPSRAAVAKNEAKVPPPPPAKPRTPPAAKLDHRTPPATKFESNTPLAAKLKASAQPAAKREPNTLPAAEFELITPPVAKREPSTPPKPVFEIESEIQAMVAAKIESKKKSLAAAATDTESADTESADTEPVVARTVASAEDTLAAIMALSDEERIALFT